MRVGPNKAPGILLVCLATALGAFSVITLGSVRSPGIADYGPLIGAAACAIGGLALASRTVFELAEDQIVVFALLGPLTWRYPFARLADVRIVDDRVVIGDRTLPIRKRRCDARDWAKFVAALREAAAT